VHAAGFAAAQQCLRFVVFVHFVHCTDFRWMRVRLWPRARFPQLAIASAYTLQNVLEVT